MKVKKYQSPSGSLPRRRLKFTPEQVALFESSFLNKGTNNSGGQKLKEEGVLALQHLELKKREEEARIRSRSERPHVLKKRKATLGGKDEYELTTLVVGMSGRDPLLGTIFDLYVGGKGAESLFKSGSWLYNNGKIILKSIPYNSENFYRAVSKDAIKDALKSGIIRSSSKEYLYNPYFSHGRLFWTGERVIEGRQGPVLWVKAKGPNGEYSLDDVIKPGEKNLSSGHVPTEVFPYSNGSTQVSTEGFSYWKKHPIVGWREYKFKQGGKMNTLLFLKNGSGIHIKKKNRGKFTDYCGGKVTDECIRRAKASGNPTLVKRATFAANARKWKHKNGGKAFVKGVNILDSNPKAYKYVKKKYKMRMALDGTKVNWGTKIYNALNSDLGKSITGLVVNGAKTMFANNELNKALAANDLSLNKKYDPNNFIDEQAIWNEVDLRMLQLLLDNPEIHYGEIDRLLMYLMIRRGAFDRAKLLADYLKAIEKTEYNKYVNQLKNQNTFSLLDNISGTISGIGNYLGKKNSPTTSVASTKTPSASTSRTNYNMLLSNPIITTGTNNVVPDFKADIAKMINPYVS